MGKLTKIILFLILLHFIFATFPYMLPTLNKAVYLPYELWFISLLILYGLLPTNVGEFVFQLS